MPSLIIRHQSGGKAQQEIVYTEAELDTPLTIGRDASNRLSFTETDDAASRHHARIEKTASGFRIVDLRSANGLYRNGARVENETEILHNDIVAFGKGGPEIMVRFDPPPVAVSKVTRVVNGPGSKPTVVRDAQPAVSIQPKSIPAAPVPAAPAGVGRDTVERMINTEKKSSNRKMNVMAALLAVAGVAGAWQFHDARQGTNSNPNVAKTILDNYSPGTMRLEVSWNLLEKLSRKQIYHEAFRPEGSEKAYPAYLRMEDGSIEPYLTTDPKGPATPISGRHSGTGFVVSSDGRMLTNRHVAAAWFHEIQLPFPGILLTRDPKTRKWRQEMIQSPPEEVAQWIPAKSKLFTGAMGVSDTGIVLGISTITAFAPKSSTGVAVEYVSSSEESDISMVRLTSGAANLQPLQLSDTYDSTQKGDKVHVLGYPGGSQPGIAGSTGTGSANNGNLSMVTDVSYFTGVISKIVRGAKNNNTGKEVKTWGDFYETTASETGPGNSGGPAFDDNGKVIGILTYKFDAQRVSLTGVVPIRYAMPLLDPTRWVTADNGPTAGTGK